MKKEPETPHKLKGEPHHNIVILAILQDHLPAFEPHLKSYLSLRFLSRNDNGNEKN